MRIRTDLVERAPEALRSSVVVIDDFYEAPDAIRDRALRLTYPSPKGSRYPGLESQEAITSSSLIDAFSELAGLRLEPAKDAICGKIRIGLTTRAVRTSVHLDHVDWSAIVYLTPDAPSKAGLSIFRHGVLGIDRIDADDLAPLYGCHDKKEFDARYVRPYTLDESAWETLLDIDYAYNRLLLLESGSLFHGINDLFGKCLTTGRMTHSFFMDEAA